MHSCTHAHIYTLKRIPGGETFIMESFSFSCLGCNSFYSLYPKCDLQCVVAVPTFHFTEL